MAEEDRYTRITLRIPKDLIPQLKEAADARSHSMNAEIIQRVERSFPKKIDADELFGEFISSSKPKDVQERDLIFAWRSLSTDHRQSINKIISSLAEYDCDVRNPEREPED